MKKQSDIILPDKKKKPKQTLASKFKKTNNTKVYTSNAYKRKSKKDAEARRRAEERAKMPKNPIKRFFYHLHPKRVFKWWFSWRGQKRILKILAACVLIGIIFIGGLFIYYKKDLEEIQLDSMQISETVNTYLDRNGVVLWKDTGSDNYRLVVDAEDISPYMYQATIAIEDKNFYSHMGVDLTALMRATFLTVTGQTVQGGSTLTQQLIKQVYFSDEAASADRGGLSRKIKELILAIELERMYSKDQIITMYLNQSPYGGRRNGVESAARTYFNKSAKDLTLAESALLAAIPNNPAILNPYYTAGNEALIARQHKVLDAMVSMGYITSEEAEEAKAVDILATIQPESSQYADALAPHFVLEVKAQLEEKYGISTMRAGGWTIVTTLDYEAQKIAEEAVADAADYNYIGGGDNIAMVSLDVETSQVIAMVGSIDFDNEEFGQQNVTTSLIEPGSSIKPILDYAPLLMQRDGINFGAGSILKNENIDSLYCGGTSGSCMLRNANEWNDPTNTTIRYALGHSMNIQAVKALYINGIENSLEVARDLGETSLCQDQENYGLAIAIGSGCGIRLVEHANSYASLARGGSYKELTYVLEVKNSSGDVMESWTDTAGEQVVDSQVAYIISDILSDRDARYPYYAYGAGKQGFIIPDVWTATKTGTTTNSQNVAKDMLMVSYSTSVATVVWNGNHDGSVLKANDNHKVGATVISEYMERVHKEVYEPQGKWNYGDEPVKPAGIQTLTVAGVTDIWPSWYDEKKNSGISKETLVFNRYNYHLAAECTPESYKISIEATVTVDPMTKNSTYSVPEPYDYETTDTCDYIPPVSVTIMDSSLTIGSAIRVVVVKGSSSLSGYTLYVDDNAVENGTASSDFTTDYKITGEETSVKVTVSDDAGYIISDSKILTPTSDDD